MVGQDVLMWMTPDGRAHTVACPPGSVPGLAEAIARFADRPTENRTVWSYALDSAEDAEFERIISTDADDREERRWAELALPDSIARELDWQALLDEQRVEQAVASIGDRWRLDVIALLQDLTS